MKSSRKGQEAPGENESEVKINKLGKSRSQQVVLGFVTK